MDKNKRVALVVLLVIGIGLCTWSIYNSVVSMSQSDNNLTTGNNSNSSNNNQNNGNPTIIDDEDDKDDDKDDKDNETTEKDDDEKDTETSGQNIKNESQTYITYTVGEDETLKDICEKYSDKCPVSILSKAILSVNNLKSSKDIKAGIKIKIPEKYTAGGLKYTVKSGDTLSSIVNKYMEDLDYSEATKMLKTDNFLTSDTIRVGDELFVAVSDLSKVNADADADVDDDKDDEDTNASDEESTTTMSTLTNRIGTLTTYTVKKGDTLASISKKYSETCPSKAAGNIILKINNLSKSTDVKEGLEIKLPEKYLSQGQIYKVKSGDTLSGIVSENMGDLDWNEAVAIMSQDNDLKNNVIIVDQELFIASISE